MSNISLVLLPIFTQNLMLIWFSRFLSLILCQQHSMNIYNFLYWLSMAHLVCILRKWKSTHVWICTGTNVCLINYSKDRWRHQVPNQQTQHFRFLMSILIGLVWSCPTVGCWRWLPATWFWGYVPVTSVDKWQKI